MGEPVKDEYLVFLVDGDRHEVPGIAQGLAKAHQGHLIKIWNDGVHGFWVSMNEKQAEGMLHDPHIRSIEENGVAHESGTQAVGGSDPFWHLDRIDQRSAMLDSSFQYCNGATQVYAYVFDRGVRAADPQLTGRVQAGTNASPPDGVDPSHTAATDPPPYPDGASFDERNPCGEHNVLNAGHGTSVATLLAGSSVGVSKTTIVVPLRIANCQGLSNQPKQGDTLLTSGALIDAFDWLFGSSNGLWDSVNNRSRYPAVANFSIWINVPDATVVEYELETRVRRLIHGGVVVVASANNQNLSDRSLTQSPTRLSYSNPHAFNGPERLISAGGTMLTNSVDQRWVCPSGDPACSASDPGSNYGQGIDIWAPAYNIQAGHLAQADPSTGDPWTGPQYRRPFYFGPPDRIFSPLYARNGTSFAAPIVAGAAARLLSEDPSLFNDPSTTALAVWDRLSASATHLDPISANLGAGSPNIFLYIGGVNFRTQPQSQSVDAGGSATLSAEAVGSGLSYRLYEGHSGNLNVSTLVRDWQASGTFSSLPSTTKTYWIRATSTCPADGSSMTGDSAEATILQRPVVTATATATGSSVTVSWTPDGSTGTTYDLFRAYAGSPFDFNQPYQTGLGATATPFTDSAVQTNHTYVYKVRATNGTVTAMSLLPDYATTIAFTDADLTVSPTVKAVHITELRLAVDMVAEAMGIADPYTAAELNPSPLVFHTVTAADYTDVMTRLSGVRTQPAYGLSAVSFSPALVPGQTTILKSHLITLRNATN